MDKGDSKRTEADTWVLLSDGIALLVGEEHVCGKTSLGRVGVLIVLVWCLRECSGKCLHTLLLLSVTTGLGCGL